MKILQAARAVRARLDTLRGAAFDEVRRDVAQQLGRLVFPGFITPDRRRPAGRRRALPARRRLAAGAAAQGGGASTATGCAPIQELEDLYRRRLEELPAGRSADGELSEVPWLLEELRMSQFAQAIGSKGQVSSRKIRRILDEAR